MGAAPARSFINYYRVLQISTEAEPETIHCVYRILAMRYHPDNPQTADQSKFILINRAYDILKDPERRSAYDKFYVQQEEQPQDIGSKALSEGPKSEGKRRISVLNLLYHKRRLEPESPGLSLLQLEDLTAFPQEHLYFTLWFLQEKSYVRFSEDSRYEITGKGTEYTESQRLKNEHPRKRLNSARPVKQELMGLSGVPVDASPNESSCEPEDGTRDWLSNATSVRLKLPERPREQRLG